MCAGFQLKPSQPDASDNAELLCVCLCVRVCVCAECVYFNAYQLQKSATVQLASQASQNGGNDQSSPPALRQAAAGAP